MLHYVMATQCSGTNKVSILSTLHWRMYTTQEIRPVVCLKMYALSQEGAQRTKTNVTRHHSSNKTLPSSVALSLEINTAVYCAT